QPVPELPKSSAEAGWAKPATPTPRTCQANGPVRSTFAPSARMDLAVLRTSSPSRRPEIRVSPTESAPRMRARCEIDLSPGTRTFPDRGPLARDSSGVGVAEWVKIAGPLRGRQYHMGPKASRGRQMRQTAIDTSLSTSQVKHRFSEFPRIH